MTYRKSLAAVLLATTLLSTAAFAAELTAAPAIAQETAAEKMAEKDVGKISKDGAQAFRDMHLARIAIFEANPDQAKDLIGKAKAALEKAKTDESVFTKAEADMKTPGDMAASKTTDAKDNTGTQAKADAKPTSQEQIAWLPVDAQLTLGEDFKATPEKASAVNAANESLTKGDKKAALDKLRLADIDVSFVMAVLPLDKTVANVDQAATMIGEGKYYEANALLKSTEDLMRVNVVDAVATPQKGAPHSADKTAPKSETKPQDAKPAK